MSCGSSWISPESRTRPAGTPRFWSISIASWWVILRPSGEHIVDLVVACLALGEIQWSKIGAPYHFATRSPFLVVDDADHDPLLVTGTPIGPLRYPAVRSVAPVHGLFAAEWRRHERFSGQARGRLALGEIDVGVLAGSRRVSGLYPQESSVERPNPTRAGNLALRI